MSDPSEQLQHLAEDLGTGEGGFTLSELTAYASGADSTWAEEIEEAMERDESLARFVADLKLRMEAADRVDTSRIDALHDEIDRAVGRGKKAVEALSLVDRPAWYQTRVQTILDDWPEEKKGSAFLHLLTIKPVPMRIALAAAMILVAVITYRAFPGRPSTVASYPKAVRELLALYSQAPPDRVSRSGQTNSASSILKSPDPDDFTLPSTEPTFRWSDGRSASVKLIEVDDLGNIIGSQPLPLTVDGESAKVAQPLLGAHFYMLSLATTTDGGGIASESIVFRAPTPEDVALLGWVASDGKSDAVARAMVLFKAGFFGRAVKAVTGVSDGDYVNNSQFANWKSHFEATLQQRRENRKLVIVP